MSTIVLTVSLLLAMACVNAQDDQPQYYRVELIVFSHAAGQPDDYRTTELGDFSERLDPLQLAEAERAALEAAEQFRRLSTNPQTPAESTSALPEPYLALAELSEPMQDALDRLDRSAGYEALTWRAWIQTAERRQRTRWLRLHDEQTIQWTDDTEADTAVIDPEEPAVHYRLDGQTRLRRTQFLNLALNLEWREAAGRPAPTLQPGRRRMDTGESASQQAQAWRIHRFEQSRAVRVDRLEYFDSEWLGVVALITEVEPPPEPEPETDLSEAAEDPVGS
ncbi:MAG: CsiV family protein [Pseudomonadota bacterium]